MSDWIGGAYEKLAVSTSAVGLTTANFDAREAKALVAVETDNVRWLANGSDPTSTDGMPLVSGDMVVIEGKQSLCNLKFIRSGSVDAAVDVHVFLKL